MPRKSLRGLQLVQSNQGWCKIKKLAEERNVDLPANYSEFQKRNQDSNEARNIRERIANFIAPKDAELQTKIEKVKAVKALRQQVIARKRLPKRVLTGQNSQNHFWIS